MKPVWIVAIVACVAQPLAGPCAWAQSDAKPKPKFVQSVAKGADIARVADAKEGERIMVDIAVGSIECTVDDKATETRVAAELSVDGKDAADAERRAKLVKLYAERASDGTIIVNAVYPGERLPYDSVKLTVVAPPTAEIVLKSMTGSVRAKGTTGDLRARTNTGSVVVENHRGPLDVRATDGRIDVTGANESVQAITTNGAINLALADGNDQPFKVESRNGAVRVEVGAEFDGVVNMTTTGGAISVVDPAKRARLSQHSETRLVADLGAAASQCEIKTSNGSVTLVAAQAPAKKPE
ncbi:MAG: DUF4097 family beta strand repeat-containing protein [bacterium]|jgi:hypothetical protein